MRDVVVVGGGVEGCAIARELSRYRLAVTLVERRAEVAFGTTKTNSGIIHAGHHSSPKTLKGRLVVAGNQAFDRLQRELGFGFRRCGEVVVAQSDDEVPHLDHLYEQGTAKGVTGLEKWDRDRLRREEPNLSNHLVAGLYAPTAGVINPYEFAFALAENAVANGVELLVDFEVQAIDRPAVAPAGGARFVVRAADGRTVEARYVVNAAGVRADLLAAMVDLHDFRIVPRKGEEYMLDKRLQGVVRRLIFPVPQGPSKGILIIPTYDGTIMVGPTADDTDDRDESCTSTEGSDRVFDFVRRVCPSIHPRHTIAEFAGLRAAASGDDFIIGPTSVPGFVNVAGIQSPGLTASPAIAAYVLDVLGREGLPLVAAPDFDPHVDPPPRFAQQPPAVRRGLAASDPAFGRVVCRCELVTEAEIHQAVDHGARTLDGVKFRTRAGMGRCQGGFCTCRIMQILADRMDVPFEKVTKRGGHSWVVKPMTAQGTEAPKC